MNKIDIVSGTGFFDLDIFIQFNHFIVDVLYLTSEKICPSAQIHTKNYYELNYFYNGRGIVYADGKSFEIDSGTFLLIPPDSTYKIETDSKNVPEKYVIAFIPDKFGIKKVNANMQMYQLDCESLSNIIYANEVTVCHQSGNRARSVDTFKALLREFLHNYNVEKEYLLSTYRHALGQKMAPKTVGSKLKLNLYLSEIFVEFLLNVPTNEKYSPSQLYPITPYWMKYSIMTILESSYKDITLNELAHRLSISQRQLHRYMLECYGMTFKEKLTEVRINIAKHLLESTKVPVDEIGSAVGINSKNYFQQKFKEYTGVTPRRYRKNFTN